MNRKDTYNAIAKIAAYPGSDYKECVNECMDIFRSHYPDSAREFERFASFVNSKSVHEIEEVYSITFHIQAICYLDLGYVLFGEDYHRGDFLVHMKREQEKVGNDCGAELADNLANVFTLMAKMPDDEFLNELAVRVVQPAMRKMLDEFDQARMDLKKKVIKKKQKAVILENVEGGNIYRNALKAILLVVEKDFAGIEYNDDVIEPNLGSSFLNDCGTCSTSQEPTKTQVK